MHRDGQTADVVAFDVFAHTAELADAWERALGEAATEEHMTGQPQKLRQATIV
jgi:hypothetical protein